MIYTYRMNSPFGSMTAASEGGSIIGLWFDEQKYFADTIKAETRESDLPVFKTLQRWLDCYFSGNEPDFLPPLAPEGSAFRKAVWTILLQIPYGQVTTYGDIAAQLEKDRNKRQSAQAVGGAVGHNPISILIPCHRVIGADGSLTGYAGGIDKKLALLKLEKLPTGKLLL